MFDNVRDYFYQRRRGLATAAGFVGAFYLAGRYVLERLEEMREQVVQEKTARENLRRRFQQNQQDCTYTVLALVPTLGDRILEEMDVEGVTYTLQMQSRAAKTRLEGPMTTEMNTSTLSLNTEQPSVTSSMELSVPTNERKDTIPQSPRSQMGESPQSWVDQFTATSSASDVESGVHYVPPSPTSSSGAHLSDSVTSTSASLISGSDEERSGAMIESLNSTQSETSEIRPEAIPESAVMTTKSKAELWREVKMLTFTRTLTILYSTTLLSLLTHIQLNLLGRYKYVQSVFDLEREEKLRERQSFEASVSNLFFGGGDLAGVLESLENEEQQNTLGLFGTGRTGSTERKYLTLSWWLIHIGWKEVGGRVRAAVEDVFEGVSLKAKLGIEDLENLLKQVRQKIEFDESIVVPDRVEDEAQGAAPGRPRISFLSSLVPMTPEGLTDVLVQGGISLSQNDIDDPAFRQLVDETRNFISSADFGRVLETCLDYAFDVLFDGLKRTLFPEVAFIDKVRLAGLLPGVARWSHSAVHGTPNDLVEGLAEVRELAGFSAIIYSSYTENLK